MEFRALSLVRPLIVFMVLFLLAKAEETNEEAQKKVIIIASCAAGVAALVIIALVIALICVFKKRRERTEELIEAPPKKSKNMNHKPKVSKKVRKGPQSPNSSPLHGENITTQVTIGMEPNTRQVFANKNVSKATIESTQVDPDEFPTKSEFKRWKKQRLSKLKGDREEKLRSGYYQLSFLFCPINENCLAIRSRRHAFRYREFKERKVHELRRLLVSLYVKCMIYYALSSPNFSKWVLNETILKAIELIQSNSRYVDNDPMFCAANDEDFDLNLLGISRQSFIELYGEWIAYCLEKRRAMSRQDPSPYGEILESDLEYDENLVTCFCFALSILGRRCLGAAAYNRHANAAESFLFGLHALFKGDLRVTNQNDEWVCTDPDILSSVIAPSVRMALKLHQDHFAAADDFEELSQLYDRILHYQSILFISHEHDPAWRQAIIANTPSLLALRHMYDDGQDDYKIIMLNKMHLNMRLAFLLFITWHFRVIKLNRECVRAFWSGQQQELIFLRNRNPERGSIQNARQVLRNMINSSADQPIGYPIYVSPLTTSFVETHSQISQVTGPDITFCTIWDAARRLVGRLRRHFDTSGSSNLPANIVNSGGISSSVVTHANPIGPVVSQAGSTPAPSRKRASQLIAARAGSIALGTSTNVSTHERNVAEDTISHVSKMSSITGAIIPEEPSVVSVIKEHRKSESFSKVSIAKQDSISIKERPQEEPENSDKPEESYAEIVDEKHVLQRLNEPLKATGELLVSWPNEEWKACGGKTVWNFAIEKGMTGQILHTWTPFHPNKMFRSFAGHIYLLKVKHEEDIAYVPVLEEGLKFLKSCKAIKHEPTNEPTTPVESDESTEI